MTAALIVAGVGAVAAVAGTGVLAARCARAPRLYLVAWTLALFGLAVSLAAQALGYLSGYSALVFRAMELGAQAIAPLALCLGLVEMLGRSVVSRFAMRLAVSATGIIVLVVLGADPLNPSVTLGKTWPDPGLVYQLVPAALIKFVAAVTLATALGSALAAAVKSGRGPAGGQPAGPALLVSAAAVVVAAPGVSMLAGVVLHSSEFAAAGLLAAVLTWLGGVAADRRGLADARDAGAAPRTETGRRARGQRDLIGDSYDAALDRYGAAARAGYRDGLDGPPDSTGTSRRFGGANDDIGYPALAALAAEPARTADRGDLAAGRGDPAADDSDLAGGALEPYGQRPAPDGLKSARMFGQITIYTVLDERISEFDRLTEQVVEQVRAREPGTLVYIVHAVPTAPMQRILYEVYQDRSAYDEHLGRPYVANYESQRRSMVLATNAIELGLQQAKVSPLPSYSAISDILSESGIDLTGVTRGQGSDSGRYEVPGGRDEPYAGESYADESYPGESYAEMPYDGEPYPGERYAGEPYASEPYASEPYGGERDDDRDRYEAWGERRGEDRRYR